MAAPWFESPFFEQELERSDLSAEERTRVSAFADQGYVIWRPPIAGFDQLAEKIIAACQPEWAANGPRLQDAWRFAPAVKQLAVHPEVMKTLRQIYGRPPVPFQTLDFQRGSEQNTHSDSVHFAAFPQRFMAGVWFALEDVGEDNGPLHYYPGSHRLPFFELHDVGLSGASLTDRNATYEQYELFMQDLLRESELPKQTVHMKRGEALIWAANLLHGGNPINDPSSTRYSQVTHYYFEGCRYYAPLYSDPPLGKYQWKQVINIATNDVVPHVYNGSTVRLPVAVRARGVVEGAMRSNPLGRRAIAAAKRILTDSS